MAREHRHYLASWWPQAVKLAIDEHADAAHGIRSLSKCNSPWGTASMEVPGDAVAAAQLLLLPQIGLANAGFRDKHSVRL